MNRRFLQVIQQRTARVAVGASAARRQGAPGVVQCAREFASQLKLARFATRSPAAFRRRLDVATRQLQKQLPTKAASWGLARKLLNIFIRDCVYVGYLRRAYGLHVIEAFCEIPLDSITAKEIRSEAPELPRWPGVKHLRPELSDQYQQAAQIISKRRRIARVHLDAYWWGARE